MRMHIPIGFPSVPSPEEFPRVTATTAEAASRAAQILSRPTSINGLTVPNRIVMAPMTRMFSPGGIPGEDVASYYSRRAAAGVGLIVTEGTYVGHDSAGNSDRVPRFHGEEQLAGWAKVAEDVHAAGGTIVPQLWHIGMVREQGQAPYADAPAVGPSGLVSSGAEPTGKAMTQADVDDVVNAFAEAAAAAERIGFDGVEIHGAHGYLLDQFLWAGTNRRTDAYGGDAVARANFSAEIVAAVRESVSADFPILFRYSQWKQQEYTARLAETPGAGGDPQPAGRRRRRCLPRLYAALLAPRVRGLRPQPRRLDEEAHRQAGHHRRLGRPRR